MNNTEKIIETAMKMLSQFTQQYNRIFQQNHSKVLEAFRDNKVTDECFRGSTGYGYNDSGRKILNQVYAQIFKGEAALVSSHFASGTHTIYTGINSLVNMNNKILAIADEPYDTLYKAFTDQESFIKNKNICFDILPLQNTMQLDLEAFKKKDLAAYKLILLQRSKGYSLRPSISIDEIEEVATILKEKAPNTILFVDNCYGEFVEDREPLEVGAHVIAGSLIKNPGGTLVASGGYLIGEESLINKISDSFTVPAIGRKIGAVDGTTLRLMFQGLYLAPKTVEEAFYSSLYASLLFEGLGYKTYPKSGDKRTDVVQAIAFKEKDKLIRFCQLIQSHSPVDSFVQPIPWLMPGYDHEVIMASGSFISGSSSELSADGPIREPYAAYLQGGTSFHYSKYALDNIIKYF